MNEAVGHIEHALPADVVLLDEQSRRQMQGRFIFDDRIPGVLGGYRQTVAKTANYTVVAGARRP